MFSVCTVLSARALGVTNRVVYGVFSQKKRLLLAVAFM